tara:strand:+ start:28 stop:999 length:972 start_codon:yes stop_codon:yes gene_type:complete
MDIHFKESFRIENYNAELIFFDKKNSKEWDSYYVNLINTAPTLTSMKYNIRWILEIHDKENNSKNEYKVKKSGLNIQYFKNKEEIDRVNPIKFLHYRKNLLTNLSIKELLINNDLSDETIMTNELFDKLILNNNYKFIPIYTEVEEIIWEIDYMTNNNHDYFMICVINDKIVGRVTCNILDDNKKIREYMGKDTMYLNMNLYIANVDVHPDFQGKGLCRPILSFMIKHLRRMDYEMLYISNESETYGGIPACICYYKSGIENNYKMKYAVKGLDISNKNVVNFKPMNTNSCIEDIPHPSTLYYISDKIGKRGKEKFRKFINKK